MQGAPEVRRGPAANAGLRIGCQVGGVNRAERRGNTQAAGVVLATACSVAAQAVAGTRQVSAAFDQAAVQSG